MRNLIVIALALLALGAVTCFAEAPPGKATSRPRWEYQTLSRETLLEMGKTPGKTSLTAGLNKAGEDGWELVAVTGSQEARPGAPSVPAEYYFKRLKGPVSREANRAAVPAPEAAPDELQVIRLRFARARDMADTLQAVFRDQSGSQIVPEPRTNTLILRGSAIHVAEVKALVRELDVEGEQKKGTP
jgi:hypothetical protein